MYGPYLEDHPNHESKWFRNPHLKRYLGHLEGEQPNLGGLLTMVINHLLTGMTL